MKTKTLVHYSMILGAALVLSACGGGGGGGPTVAPNTAPTVTGPVMNVADDNNPAYTISTAELIANASDADGDTLTVTGLTISSGNAVGVTINGPVPLSTLSFSG